MTDREPLIDLPPPHEPSEDAGDVSDAPWRDPKSGDAVKAAGCSVRDELDQLEVRAKS